MNELNAMCLTCAKCGAGCDGTICQTWTGCVYYRPNNKKRVFQSYKRDLVKTALPTGIRYNVIQYVCHFPGIDPVEMAASLQSDGYTILFDDTSISKKANETNRRAVNKYMEAC